MEEFEKYVTLMQCDSTEINIHYVDTDNNLNFSLMKKEIDLTKNDKSKINELLVEKIKELTESNPNSYILDTTLEDKIKQKFNLASSYIAVDGRIGLGNTVLISKNNFDKLKLEDITKNYEILFDENIDDIYIYRKNMTDQPGLILAYTENEFELICIGFYPEKQFIKIKLK